MGFDWGSLIDGDDDTPKVADRSLPAPELTEGVMEVWATDDQRVAIKIPDLATLYLDPDQVVGLMQGLMCGVAILAGVDDSVVAELNAAKTTAELEAVLHKHGLI